MRSKRPSFPGFVSPDQQCGYELLKDFIIISLQTEINEKRKTKAQIYIRLEHFIPS